MVVTRFAPSPTGFLHVGGARTALFSWLHARRNGGKFILRIEDTDVQRSTDASTEQILESLKWLGIDWDEGPVFQSQRLHIYQEHLQKLWQSDAIYPAFETKEELDAARAAAEAAGTEYVYDRASAAIPHDEADRRMAAGHPFAWRFRTPTEGYTEVPETLRGDNDVKFSNVAMGDFIITRHGTASEPGMPLYNFVCTVDDALMAVTHVIRGEEHLNNTPKQILLYKALGYPIPSFTHLPLVLKKGKKMSKRDADADPRFPVSVSGRRDLGYLPEATINFISLLGWSFPGDRELYPREELLANFTLDRLVKSAANFDEDKYIHQNGWWLRNMPREQVVDRALPFLASAGQPVDGKSKEWIAAAISLVIERVSLLSEIPAALSYFFTAPADYEAKGAKKVFGEEGVADILAETQRLLATVSDWRKEPIEAPLRAHCEANGLGLGKVAQPVRLAISGRTATPGLFEVLELLGRDEVLARLATAEKHLRAGTLPLAGA